MGELYKITFKTSGKSYVGITTRSMTKRVRQHAAPSCTTLVGRAYNKYGRGDTTIEILAMSDSFEELCRLEREAIGSHNTLSPNGYNRTVGGEGVLGHIHSEETRVKLSKSASETMKSIEARARISAALKRHYQNPEARAKQSRAAKIQVHIPESKAKVSAAMKGRKLATETKEKIGAARRARVPRLEKNCQRCGSLFSVKPSHSNQTYCSKPCADEAQIRTVQKECARCGKTILVKKSKLNTHNYCSRKCSSRSRVITDVTRNKLSAARSSGVTKKCKKCGVSFHIKPSAATRRVFCSIKCYREDQIMTMAVGQIEGFNFIQTASVGDSTVVMPADRRAMFAIRECMLRAVARYPRHVVPLPEPRVTSPDEYRLALYIWTGELK